MQKDNVTSVAYGTLEPLWTAGRKLGNRDIVCSYYSKRWLRTALAFTIRELQTGAQLDAKLYAELGNNWLCTRLHRNAVLDCLLLVDAPDLISSEFDFGRAPSNDRPHRKAFSGRARFDH